MYGDLKVMFWRSQVWESLHCIETFTVCWSYKVCENVDLQNLIHCGKIDVLLNGCGSSTEHDWRDAHCRHNISVAVAYLFMWLTPQSTCYSICVAWYSTCCIRRWTYECCTCTYNIRSSMRVLQQLHNPCTAAWTWPTSTKSFHTTWLLLCRQHHTFNRSSWQSLTPPHFCSQSMVKTEPE